MEQEWSYRESCFVQEAAETAQPTIQVLPSIIGVSGRGYPAAASLALSEDSRAATLTFLSVKSPIK
jgi:hypothetical protein